MKRKASPLLSYYWTGDSGVWPIDAPCGRACRFFSFPFVRFVILRVLAKIIEDTAIVLSLERSSLLTN